MELDFQALKTLQKNFALQNDFEREVSEKEVLQSLIKAIQYYLDNSFERLLQIMYRLDINEEKFTNVLTNSETEKIAKDIAILVLEREKERWFIRQKYS